MRSFSVLVIFALSLAVSAQDQQPYFPNGVLSEIPRVDVFKTNWYSNQLRALNEPSLLSLATDHTQESYRFVWLRSFHHPVVVRLSIAKDGIGKITSKEGNGAGGYKPGKADVNKLLPATPKQTQAFLAKIEQTDFWNILSQDTTPGLDGAQWIVEGVKNGKYHVVDKWSPKEGPIRELGLALLDLGHMKQSKRETY